MDNLLIEILAYLRPEYTSILITSGADLLTVETREALDKHISEDLNSLVQDYKSEYRHD